MTRMRVQIPPYSASQEDTPVMTPHSATSANEVANGQREDASSFVHVLPNADVMSNDDPYNTMTPPAYTQSITGSEVPVEAPAYKQEKLKIDTANINARINHNNPDSPGTARADSPHHSPTPPTPPRAGAPKFTAQRNNEYFTESTNEAAHAYVRRCSVLDDRPAVWLVKRKTFALSSLAAAVLVEEGLLESEDLALISQDSGIKRDPTDPLSAVCFATYDTVGDVMNGLIAGPMEATLESAPSAAKQVVIGTGKGLGRIIGAGLKAPMTFTHGISRGFHNAPKLYGEQVREYENITDLKSGLLVSAKGFGYGISDGLSGFFVKPIQGAQKEGVKGFAKGFGAGVGNLVCKPASGAVGLVGYSFVGMYKQLQAINFSGKDTAGDDMRYRGEEEYENASKELRLKIVNRWCARLR